MVRLPSICRLRLWGPVVRCEGWLVYGVAHGEPVPFRVLWGSCGGLLLCVWWVVIRRSCFPAAFYLLGDVRCL